MSERTVTEAPPAVVPADLADERLIREEGLTGRLKVVWNRLRGGELGSLPVIVGLVLISIVFYVQQPAFLSSRSLVNITLFAAPVGVIALGIVLVLLLGEIDLSVGSVSGFAAATAAVLTVGNGQSFVVGMLAGLGVGVAIGLLYSLLYVRVGVPSFVISLAGLLGFQGALLWVLGDQGTINLPDSSPLVQFARYQFVSGVPAYLLVVVIAAAYLTVQLVGVRRRQAASLSAPSIVGVVLRSAALLVGLLALTWYLSIDRGWSYLWLFFVLLVVIMDLALRKTRWGRHVFAVGGNEEAARRSGIAVPRVYVSVFVLCSTLAALGGLLAMGQLTSVSQASGTTDTNLTAIAAAVIGGTSLFGGRGSAYAAMLGVIVLQAIQSGLNLMGVDSSVRFMVTGAVLIAGLTASGGRRG